MLTIRFNRTGKKNRASYRVVLQEKAKAPGKRHVEILGSHDPQMKTTVLRKDRIQYWISQGAQPSPVVHNLLVAEGVIEGKKIAKKMPRPAKKEEERAEEPVAEAKAEEAPAEPAAEAAPEAAPQEEAVPEVLAPEEPITEVAPEAAKA